MEKPQCPKCDSNLFELNRKVKLVNNTVDKKEETVDLIQCNKCGTVIGVANLDKNC